MGPREVLNKLRWQPGGELGLARIVIAHRGAPGDRRVIDGKQITGLGRGFMSVTSPEGEVEIPYHRILRIEVRGRVLWQR